MQMGERAALINRFLAQSRWSIARQTPLAGDASSRRYFRLTLPGSAETAILMDAPPQLGEDVRLFVRIAEYLRSSGLSAPRVLDRDEAQGLLLLEDFGDMVFARMIADDPDCEDRLYHSSVEVLVHLHQRPPPDNLTSFTPALMAEQAGLVYDCYAMDAPEKQAFCAKLVTILDSLVLGEPVIILRDYHAENLIWLPDRDGVASVGLLDFQDAMVGPVGYDLISLLYDARRDVSPAVADRMVRYFAASVGLDAEAFDAARAALCAQRNLRILGIFARLSRQYGKTGYIDLIPRVWAHVTAALKHPALTKLADHVYADLPAPSPDHLNRLRSACSPSRP